MLEFSQRRVTEPLNEDVHVLNIEGNEGIWKEIYLFMDTDDDTHTQILGTRYIFLTIDATLSDNQI